MQKTNRGRKSTTKRINVTIPEIYYDKLISKDIKLSGLISDLLKDHLEGLSITIRVSEDTRDLYDRVVSNMNYEDADVEVGLRGVLQQLIDKKIKEFEDLKKRLSTTVD